MVASLYYFNTLTNQSLGYALSVLQDWPSFSHISQEFITLLLEI